MRSRAVRRAYSPHENLPVSDKLPVNLLLMERKAKTPPIGQVSYVLSMNDLKTIK